MNRSSAHTRLDYLDAVRAFALLLGILFHASLSFVPVYIGWAVMDVSTSDAVSVFTLISHSFRMALFFLIAGFFSRMTLKRRSIGSFLRSRALRIGVPLVVGWFVLRPLLIAGWVMGGQSLRGAVDVGAALQAGLTVLGDLPAGLLVGTHLWFLYYLLLITFGVIVIRAVFGLSGTAGERLRNTADRFVGWLSRSHWALLVAALPTAGGLWFMSHWGMDTPDQSLRPHLPVTLIYGAFFSFGWLLQRQGALITEFAQLSWRKLGLALFATVAAIQLTPYGSEPGHARILWLKGGFVLSYALMMWTWAALCIGAFKRWLDHSNTLVRYLADASYWMYLIHLPIV
ncbi:MAG: acyltransferase family protein, partial [Pseudomonadota bacterium]